MIKIIFFLRRSITAEKATDRQTRPAEGLVE